MKLQSIDYIQENLNSIVDEIIRTGIPVRFTKDGHVLIISLVQQDSSLDAKRKEF